MGGYLVEREYIKLFLGLDNEKLYSVADLVDRAEELGLVPDSDVE